MISIRFLAGLFGFLERILLAILGGLGSLLRLLAKGRLAEPMTTLTL
jgi:hypothetical protein